MSFQVRHRSFGLYQGSFIGMGFWYPMSGMPEQGILEFKDLCNAEGFINFLVSEADVPLERIDLSIEEFDINLNKTLLLVGSNLNIEYCQQKN